MKSPDNLIWIDLEMTGLSPETDLIIEIATIVTDKHLTVLAEGPVIAVHQSAAVLAAIDLEKEPANIKQRQLRFRKLTIEPGGIVPWHSHDDRPAIIYIAEGEIVEYASNCADPIVHKAGDIRPETHGTSHWWQNLGNKTVILFVGDVLHDKNDHNM